MRSVSFLPMRGGKRRGNGFYQLPLAFAYRFQSYRFAPCSADDKTWSFFLLINRCFGQKRFYRFAGHPTVPALYRGAARVCAGHVATRRPPRAQEEAARGRRR